MKKYPFEQWLCLTGCPSSLQTGYKERIVEGLKHILSSKALVIKEAAHFVGELNALFPKFKASTFQEKSTVELALFVPKRHGIAKFYYEMLSHWLIPGVRFEPDGFVQIDFQILDQTFCLFEGVFSSLDSHRIQLIQTHLPPWIQEIEFGASSYYQSMQILEMKGLSLSEKTIALQENVAQLMHLYPDEIESDIYSLMRSMMSSTSERFKRVRTQTHISRLILHFYRQMKRIQQKDKHRFANASLIEFTSDETLDQEAKWAICATITLKSDNEVFEMHNFLHMIKGLIAAPVDKELAFDFELKEWRARFFYCEVSALPYADLVKLQQTIETQMHHSIQKFVRPVFMPRNEEEVLKSIVMLCRQLKYVKDIPQVMIHFDRQSENSVAFRVILVRLVKTHSISIEQLKKHLEKRCQISLERVRHAGMLRKKVSKEVSLWSITFDSTLFLRSDLTLDLYKARYEVFRVFRDALGDIRDFNGGLMAKQRERVERLKLKYTLHSEGELFETFFFALFPAEYRTVWRGEDIFQFFNLFLEWLNTGEGKYFHQCHSIEETRLCEKLYETAPMRLRLQWGDAKIIGGYLTPVLTS